ncbi:MAG: M28 family peptidase [Planctomycetes bacterium]|nr:M28 family peptidase [Planctomycetota bacterium]
MMRLFVILFVFMFACSQPQPLIDPQINRDTLQQHVEALCSPLYEGRLAGSSGGRSAAYYIAHRFALAGLRPLDKRDSYLIPITSGINVCGILDGKDEKLKGEIVLISAHFDSFGGTTKNYSPGANDNAAGVSALCEIAESFGLLPMSERPKRTILFVAWDAEEQGFRGSADFLKTPPFPLEHIKLMVDIDMIGRPYVEVLTNSLFCIGTESGTDLKESVEKLSKDFPYNIYYYRAETVGSFCDYANFLSAKIPAIFFTCGHYADHHLITDTPDKIDFDQLLIISSFIQKVIAHLADQEESPKFIEIPSKDATLVELKSIHSILTKILSKKRSLGLKEDGINTLIKFHTKLSEFLKTTQDNTSNPAEFTKMQESIKTEIIPSLVSLLAKGHSPTYLFELAAKIEREYPEIYSTAKPLAMTMVRGGHDTKNCDTCKANGGWHHFIGFDKSKIRTRLIDNNNIELGYDYLLFSAIQRGGDFKLPYTSNWMGFGSFFGSHPNFTRYQIILNKQNAKRFIMLDLLQANWHDKETLYKNVHKNILFQLDEDFAMPEYNQFLNKMIQSDGKKTLNEWLDSQLYNEHPQLRHTVLSIIGNYVYGSELGNYAGFFDSLEGVIADKKADPYIKWRSLLIIRGKMAPRGSLINPDSKATLDVKKEIELLCFILSDDATVSVDKFEMISWPAWLSLKNETLKIVTESGEIRSFRSLTEVEKLSSTSQISYVIGSIKDGKHVTNTFYDFSVFKINFELQDPKNPKVNITLGKAAHSLLKAWNWGTDLGTDPAVWLKAADENFYTQKQAENK